MTTITDYKRVCILCEKEFGNPNGRVMKIFCKDCLKEIANQRYLVDWSFQKEKRSLQLERH